MIRRHASPEKQGPDGTDFSRPLTGEGEAEARMQGSFLREAGIVPDVVLTSPAVRAATTAALVVEAVGAGLAVTPQEALYNAEGEALLDFLQTLPEDVHTALLVAHMPGVAELLAILARDPTDVNVNFSPATLAGVSLEDAPRWLEVVPGCGVLEWVLPPLFAG